MCNICASFDFYFPSVQYMRKICARLYFFLPMCKIWARFFFFAQCAKYMQDLHKIVILSPMHNICTRFAQDCTTFPNAQYMHKLLPVLKTITWLKAFHLIEYLTETSKTYHELKTALANSLMENTVQTLLVSPGVTSSVSNNNSNSPTAICPSLFLLFMQEDNSFILRKHSLFVC